MDQVSSPINAICPPARRVFCNRTLNLRAIKAIGYDMDYTLIHYRVDAWERRVFAHLQRKLSARGWPVDDLSFLPETVVRGLIVDTECGNILKANRFGYVKRAAHGTQQMSFDNQRDIYSRAGVDLAESRYKFLNTLFSMAEACMYLQLVDKLDAGTLGEAIGYADLYDIVRASVDEAHMEGELKAEIIASPEQFVELDAQTPITLLDQKQAGKKLLLITNSEWSYTSEIMTYAFDAFLPPSVTWRDLFDIVIVAARKPDFFTTSNPFFAVVDETGLLRPTVGAIKHGIYLGGNARGLESYLELSGDEILYVGDHLYTDVHISKSVLRWRTALGLRELEADIEAATTFADSLVQLETLMQQKEVLEGQLALTRLQQQRLRYNAQKDVAGEKKLDRAMQGIKEEITRLDEKITPLAMASGQLSNGLWGSLMRTGSDKSHLARQVERYADIYMSRVSNMQTITPFAFLRGARGTLPHDAAALSTI
ncbi:MAG: HAD-IG family 5'-nucleotidase [Myxococcota bacterium]